MSLYNHSIYNTQQIRKCEQLAYEQFNISPQVLMERAGKAVCDILLQRFSSAKNIAVFCGGGNNGGDGYVVARLLHQHGLVVTVWQVGQQDNLSTEAKTARQACKQSGVVIQPFHVTADLQHPDVVVDALCGIGVTKKLREDWLIVIKNMQALDVPVMAVDVPSGVLADTGQVFDIAVRATITVTFIGLKLGLLTSHGIAHAGEVICDTLQLPNELFSQVQATAEQIQIKSYAHYLKPRSRDWHKGLSGHVLIVGGDVGFSGAARMAAEAALRVGCGLVSVATRPEHAAILNASCPEIMSHAVKDVAQLESLALRADVMIVGPGLGQSDWAKSLWQYIGGLKLPLVVDADGLNLLSHVAKVKENWILTPHPGEAGRLLKIKPQEVQQDRVRAVRALQKRYCGVCVLKGAGSLILAPDTLPAVCDKGNPGMSTAGMGDILSGIIGGLLAQKIPIDVAAKLGVLLHAMAGDLAAEQGERGMLATDLLPYLRRL